MRKISKIHECTDVSILHVQGTNHKCFHRLELAVWKVFGEELRHTAEELGQTPVMEGMGASSSSTIGLQDFTE